MSLHLTKRIHKNQYMAIGLGLMMLLFIALSNVNGQNERHLTIPSLPQPIGHETLLITSAGQSSDSYIIKDIANRLMIHNYFMPQATLVDLEDIQTAVVVIGYSEMGEKINAINHEDELKRLKELMATLSRKEIPIIAVYVGGRQRRDKITDQLIQEVVAQSRYVISTEEGDFDYLLSSLCIEKGVPLTLVKNITDISEPLASVFR